MGADDFLPVYIVVVHRANVTRLLSNCQYIESFRNRNDMMGRNGWCFANLRSAVEFLIGLDAEVLKFGGEEDGEEGAFKSAEEWKEELDRREKVEKRKEEKGGGVVIAER